MDIVLDEALAVANTLAVRHRAGMGSVPHEHGVSFRVWAPNATAVSVIGSFNEWKAGAHPMVSEENGHWYADIAEAKPGDEYRYHLTAGENQFTRIDPYAREVTNSIGNGVISDTSFDWEDDKFVLAPLNEVVIYEMHTGTFHAQPGQPGSLEAAIEKLDEVVRLGANVIELMPVAEFAGDLSWGYNPAHIFAVETAYGGPRALKSFVKAAHQKGLAVILDVVYNHFGPSDLDLWQFDGWQENGGGGIYFYNDWRAKTPWGDTRPDYGRDQVRQMLRDSAVMWLDEFRVDGLRMDGTLFIRNATGQHNHPPTDLPDGWTLMQWITNEVRQRNKLAIAEDLQDSEWLTKPESEGGAGFHAQWCARFVHPLRAAAVTVEDEHRSMHALQEAISHTFNGDPFQRILYSESHDEVANGRSRVPQEIDPENPASWHAQKRSTLAAALAFTAPGVPMIFQGQEFLSAGYFTDTEPLDWARREDFRGIRRLYRDLIHLRLNRQGHTRGLTGAHVEFLVNSDDSKVLVFRRWHSAGPGDDVVVAVNFSANDHVSVPVRFPSSGPWRLRFSSGWTGYSDLFRDEASDVVARDPDHLAGVNLPAYTVLIYSQDHE